MIQFLTAHTASGPDGLPPSLFSIFKGQLASPLLHVFNLSINSGIVPSWWKKAEVAPIFNGKGYSNSAVNYRPISLLNVVSNILERTVLFNLQRICMIAVRFPRSSFGFDHFILLIMLLLRSLS